MSSQDQCEKCGERYTDTTYKWCKSCQINSLKKLAYYYSGIERLDDIIQKMLSNISNPWDIVYEWVPYDQLSHIKKVRKGIDFDIYSAIWDDGPLKYDESKMEYVREPIKKVFIGCPNQASFLSEVCNSSINLI